MNKLLETGRPVFVGSRMILRLVAASRESRTMPANPNGAAEVGAMRDDNDFDEGRLDAAAGCEYVDDRIRLPAINL